MAGSGVAGPPPGGWHAASPEAVLNALDAGADGLSARDVRARLDRVGPNLIPETAAPSVGSLVLAELRTPLMGALIAAGAVALALGELEDGIVVLAVVTLNALIGVAQEYWAGRAIAALADLVAEPATVRREGAWTQLPAEALVPGDIVEVA